jgi:hypothetical protein
MGAPQNNKYWKLRTDLSEDGKKISVKDLIKRTQEYIDRCVNEKLYEKDWVGKDAYEVQRPKMIVMSVYGLCAYLGINRNTFYDWKNDKKYSNIITHIEDIFRAYNLEGTSAGFLNPNIIARLEGLTEKQDITSGGKEIKQVFKIGNQEIEF